jgi:ELWxxDGT repeat protein
MLYFTGAGRGDVTCHSAIGANAIVADIAPGGESSRSGSLAPSKIADVGKAVLFTASDGVSGVELWKSDKHGTFQLQDIAPGVASSNPESMTATGKLVFFLADDNSSGRELWVIPSKAVKAPKPLKDHGHKFRNNLDPMELLYAQYNNLLDLEPPKIEER